MSQPVIDPRTLGLPETWEVSKAKCCWCGTHLIRLKGPKHPWWCGGTQRCKERQSAWMIQVGGKIVALPTPRQVEFLESTAPYTLYGGSAGPGKSWAARWGLYSWCLRVPNLRTLILRETSGELLRSHITGLMDIEVEQTLGGRFAGNPMPLARFPNGSFIEGGHMEDAAAVKKYLSSEYDIIVAEEATQYQPDTLLELITRARSSNDLLNAMGGARAWLPTNPGGPATDVLRLLFMDRDRARIAEDWPDLAYDPAEWAFVPALLDDNPYLDPRYEKQLGVLRQKWRYQQLRHGDWYASPGVFFDQFSPSVHVESVTLAEPQRLAWFRSLDWGYHDFGVVLWWTVLDDGHLHIAREGKFRGLTPEEAYREVVKPGDDALGLPHPRYSLHTFASPDMWQRRGQVGETLQETARRVGWPLRPAKTERVNGWMRVQSLLRPDPTGRPWLTIDQSCKYLIRSLQTAVSDKHDPEDVSQHDDHALESCFAAGSRVLTARGWVPIERVTLQDRAWTRGGWKAVQAVFSVGEKPVSTLALSTGAAITATLDHRLWANGAWRSLEALRYGDILTEPCRDAHLPAWSPLSLTGLPSAAIRIRHAWRTGAISSRAASIFSAAWKRCTGKFGGPRTGRFRTAITSIIATVMPATTLWRTWHVSPDGTISASTGPDHAPMPCARIWSAFDRSPLLRKAAPSYRRGDASGRRRPGNVANPSRRRASSARSPIRTLVDGRMVGSVPMPVNPHGDGNPGWMTRIACVWRAGRVSARTNTRGPAPAHPPAPQVCGIFPAGIATVYNVTVADAHEYFVEGVLVSNCRYGAMSRPAPKSHGVIDRPRGAFDEDFRPSGPSVVGASTAWR